LNKEEKLFVVLQQLQSIYWSNLTCSHLWLI
jgi:hypothetical protein